MNSIQTMTGAAMPITYSFRRRVGLSMSAPLYFVMFLWLLAGCTSSNLPPTPTPTKTPAPVLAVLSPTALPKQQTANDIGRITASAPLTPSALATLLPQIETHELEIQSILPFATSLAFDDHYLYFDSAAGLLCRAPLVGGEAEIVMVSKYWYWNPSAKPPSSCKSKPGDQVDTTITVLEQSDEWLLF